MAKPDTYKWEGGEGSIYLDGKCDVHGCNNDVNLRRFYYPTYMNGDAECEASLCYAHREYKRFKTSKEIKEFTQGINTRVMTTQKPTEVAVRTETEVTFKKRGWLISWWERVSERELGKDLIIQTESEPRAVYLNGKKIFNQEKYE